MISPLLADILPSQKSALRRVMTSTVCSSFTRAMATRKVCRNLQLMPKLPGNTMLPLRRITCSHKLITASRCWSRRSAWQKPQFSLELTHPADYRIRSLSGPRTLKRTATLSVQTTSLRHKQRRLMEKLKRNIRCASSCTGRQRRRHPRSNQLNKPSLSSEMD